MYVECEVTHNIQIERTRGLISKDRNNLATLLRTIPRSLLSRLHRIYLRGLCTLIVTDLYSFLSNRVHLDTVAPASRCHILIPSTTVRRYISLLSSTDSDLEAFSHNPTDGSFAPMPCQASANANCLNLRFLSYLAELLLQQPKYSSVG